MKEKVNTIRRERVIYDSVFKKLELDLKIKEEEVQRHIGEAIEIEQERKDILVVEGDQGGLGVGENQYYEM